MLAKLKSLLLATSFLCGASGPGILAVTTAKAQNPTCPTRPAGDSSNACASTAFVANSSPFVSLAAYCSPGSNIVSCWPTAVAATPSGGILVIPRAGYTSSAELLVNHPMTVLCGGADQNVSQHIAMSTTSSNAFNIKSNSVTIEGCVLGLQGVPSGNATGIVIGNDALRITNGGSFTNTSTQLDCATCSFTSADVGKSIFAGNVGAGGQPLFTSIASFVSSTRVLMTDAAGATQPAQTFSYGFVYTDVRLINNNISNFIRGIHKVSGQRFVVEGNYSLAKFGAIWENILWGDSGDDYVGSGNTFFSTDNAAGVGFQYTSGGGLKFIGNKVLNGLTCMQIFWRHESSIGPFASSNSIEGNCTQGVAIDGTTGLFGGTFIGNEIGIAGTPVFAGPTTASPYWSFTGNYIRTQTANTGFDLANLTYATLTGNVVEDIDASGGTAYVIRASSTNAVVNIGSTSKATVLNNLSSTTTILNQLGTAFASLPAVAKDGSLIFVTDGTPNTSPCTGGGTGALATRQATAWVCSGAVAPAGANTQVQFNNSGVFGASTGFTWVSPALRVGNTGGVTGQFVLIGATSGSHTQTVNSAVGGTPTVTWGSSSGTPAVTASSPLAITAATGDITCTTCGITTNPLSQFAATTSAQLAGVISDETGVGGVLVFNAAPTFTTSITAPLVIGGSGTTGTQLTLKTTTGVGTTDALAVVGGNNGATTFGTFTIGGLTIADNGTALGSAGEHINVTANVAAHNAIRVNNTNTSGFSTMWFGASNEGFIRYGSAVGNKLQIVASVASVPVTIATAGTDRFSVTDGQVEVIPTTAATTTTDGALLSRGGLSVVGAAVIGGAIRSNTGFNANGTAGLSVTTTVRASGGAADCTLIFTFGLKTGGTC